MGKFAYPPCNTNPVTEKPYPRHRWAIPKHAEVIVRKHATSEDPVYYYRVVCSRCGFNDPNPPMH